MHYSLVSVCLCKCHVSLYVSCFSLCLLHSLSLTSIHLCLSHTYAHTHVASSLSSHTYIHVGPCEGSALQFLKREMRHADNLVNDFNINKKVVRLDRIAKVCLFCVFACICTYAFAYICMSETGVVLTQ